MLIPTIEPIYLIFFFFFLRHYNFREVLAFSTSFFHLVRFLMQSFQFVIFFLVISLFTSFSHLFLGLPSDVYFFKLQKYWKIVAGLFKLSIYLFRISVRVLNYETPCTHEAIDSHFNYGQIMQCVVTYGSGVCVCVGGCLKSVLICKFVILYISQPDSLYLLEQGCEDPWLFFEPNRGSTSKRGWETLV